MSDEAPKKYTRTVFGRREFTDQGETFLVELRADGLHIKQPNTGQWVHITPSELACRGRCQYEFPFATTLAAIDALKQSLDQSNQEPPVPDMRPHEVVSDFPQQGPVHVDPEPLPQDPEVGGDGVGPSAHGNIIDLAQAQAGTAPPGDKVG